MENQEYRTMGIGEQMFTVKKHILSHEGIVDLRVIKVELRNKYLIENEKIIQNMISDMIDEGLIEYKHINGRDFILIKG